MEKRKITKKQIIVLIPLVCVIAAAIYGVMRFNRKAAEETQALGWEDPLEKGKATHISILA